MTEVGQADVNLDVDADRGSGIGTPVTHVVASHEEPVELVELRDPGWLAPAVDRRELEEVGAVLDDPEAIVTLEGGGDDPDGLGAATELHRERLADREGWDLDDGDTLDEPE